MYIFLSNNLFNIKQISYFSNDSQNHSLKCLFSHLILLHILRELHICKALENLLKSRLGYRVLTHVIFGAHRFYQPETKPNRLVKTRNSHTHVVAVLLENLNLAKSLAQLANARVQVDVSMSLASSFLVSETFDGILHLQHNWNV